MTLTVQQTYNNNNDSSFLSMPEFAHGKKGQGRSDV